MRTALVGASDFNAGHFARQQFDRIVAIDGGYAHVSQARVKPDTVVGDFDSLGFVPDAADVRVFPCEKDESDLQLACQAAVQDGAGTLVLYGCLGRRLDHTLATVQVMLREARAGRHMYAVGDDYALAVLHGRPGAPASLEFAAAPLDKLADGAQKNYVSVFALGGEARGVSERGLKYLLDGATVPDDVSLGLSNEFTGEAAAISVQEGSLVVVFPLAAWDFLAGEGA